MSLASRAQSFQSTKRLFVFVLTLFAAALLLAAASPSARADATVTGTVTAGAGAGIAGATVTACPWTEGAFKCEDDGGVVAGALRGPVASGVGETDVPTATTAADGTFTLTIAPGTTYTLLATRASYAPGFLGGGSSMPLVESGPHSFSATDGQTVSGKVITLSPRVTALGQGAGVDASWCKTNWLEPGEGSAEISAPFTIDLYGEQGDDLWVSEAGRILFGGAYTSGESLATTTNAQIAPFGADVDTADPFKSNQVTWGVSPDQKQLCVTWAGVKQYVKDGEPDADLVNTFQVLLTDRSGVDGRPAGDFDITFNYDEIQWDSTNRRYDPFNEIPAVAGFTNGTMAPNTFLELPGSGVSGALKDGGANQLVTGSHNAATPGRYIYEIRNDDVANEPWTLSGDVTYLNERPDNGTPVVNAWVRATMVGHESRSHMVRTDLNGHYTLSGLAPGTYSVRASAPVSNDISAQGNVELVNGESTTLNFQIKPTLGVPSGVALSTDLFGTVGEGGSPRVSWRDAIKLRVESDQCLVSVKYAMRDSKGDLIPGSEGFLDAVHDPDNPPPPWIFEGSIAPVYPSHGNSTIELIKTPCGDGGNPDPDPITQEFSVYIDPSGAIVDQWGFPVVGATVTLQRADAFEGPYADVPDGSDTMEATNRENPMTTGAGGLFGWDVIAGWYRVSATKPGYEAGESAIMQVAPERVGLYVKLGGGTAPTYSSTLSGGLAVGQTLSLTAPVGLPEGFAPVAYQWSRDGAVIAGATAASYTLTAADAGHNVAGAVVVKHGDVVADDAADPKVKISFTPFGAWSPAVAVPAAASAPAPAAAPKLVKSKKKINYKKQITVKFSCPEGCVLSLGLQIGKGKVKTFKTVKLKPGTKQYKFKLPKKYVRQLQEAFKNSKRTKAVLQIKLSNTLKTKHDTAKNSIQNAR